VPWKFQQKYKTYNDGINLVSGREMRLIEAEAALVAGNVQSAMEILNRLRAAKISTKTNQPLAARTAANAAEAWTALRRERGIEMWIEGRRLNDLRRWKANNTPGSLHPLEDPTNPQTFLSPNQALCIPISDEEYDTNRKVLRGPGGQVAARTSTFSVRVRPGPAAPSPPTLPRTGRSRRTCRRPRGRGR
jgi:hypothetical protein